MIPTLTPDGIPIFDHITAHPLNHRNVDRVRPGLTARTARQRALQVLQMLAGEPYWRDGWERQLDNCFEMNDGNEVCGWLIEWAEADPRIHALLTTHSAMSYTGSDAITEWTRMGCRGAHRQSKHQIPLALTV